MTRPIDRVIGLLCDLHMTTVDFDALFSEKNALTPLESIELFLLEQQRLALKNKRISVAVKQICLPKKQLLPSLLVSSVASPRNKCCD